MEAMTEAFLQNLLLLVAALEQEGETDATTYLNSDGEAFDTVSDQAASLIDQIEGDAAEVLLEDGELNELVVNQLAVEGFAVSKLGEKEEHADTWDFVIKNHWGKIYFI